jgi:hypothetical protein
MDRSFDLNISPMTSADPHLEDATVAPAFACEIRRGIPDRPPTMRRRLAPFLTLLIAACAPFIPGSCGKSVPVSQFGAYAPPFKRMRLPDGDTLTVYRVKHWTFSEDRKTALQLEFQTRVPLSDTAAIVAQAKRLWPAFAHYVERAQTTGAIITATNLQVREVGGAFASTTNSFGIIAVRDSAGRWRAVDWGPLPEAAPPGDWGIFEADGRPLEITPTPPDSTR